MRRAFFFLILFAFLMFLALFQCQNGECNKLFMEIRNSTDLSSTLAPTASNQSFRKLIFLASSYFLPDGKLKILAILHIENHLDPIFIHYNSNKSVVRAKKILIGVHEFHERCRFNGWFLNSELEVNLTTSDKIYLSRNPHKPQILLPNVQKVQKPVENTIAACIQPVYLFDDWVGIVKFVEYYLQIGVSKFYFYIHTITKDVETILKIYEQDGIIEIVPWSSPPSRDADKIIYNNEHLTAINDCLLRASHAEFLAILDIDEFVVLKTKETIFDVLSRLTRWRGKTVGSFLLRMNRVHIHANETNVTNAENLDFASLLGNLSREHFLWNMSYNPKQIVRPHYVRRQGVHRVMEFEKKYKYAFVPTNQAIIFHLRKVDSSYGLAKKAQRLSFSPDDSLKPFLPNATRNWRERVLKYYPNGLEMDTSRDNKKMILELEKCIRKIISTGRICPAKTFYCADKLTVVKEHEWIQSQSRWIVV